MTLRAGALALVLGACGCGRVLGADFELPDDPGIDLGDACNEAGVLSCAPDRVVATCVDGEWQRAFECPEDEHCVDQPDAQCIADEIDCSKNEGQAICVGTTAVVCDDHGKIASTSDCPGPCVGHGECRSVAHLALASSSSCALLSDGTVWCWGTNQSGELGQGENFGSQAPTLPHEVEGLSGVDQLVAASNVVCARKGGEVHCWGTDLVLGIEFAHFEPQQVTLPSLALDVVAQGNAVCVRMASGEVFCWGANESGQLCMGEPGLPSQVVDGTTIAAFSGATDLYMGWSDACARIPDPVSGDERFVCCGANDFAGGMDAPSPYNPVPVELKGVPSVENAAIGGSHVCIEDAGGNVYCWGRNAFGELCLGNDPLVPAPTLSFQSQASALVLSMSETLALDTEGNLTCCGYLCPFPGLPIATPTPFRVLTDVTDVAGATGHQCAVFHGRPLCWGSNGDGRIKAGLASTLLEPTLAGW